MPSIAPKIDASSHPLGPPDPPAPTASERHSSHHAPRSLVTRPLGPSNVPRSLLVKQLLLAGVCFCQVLVLVSYRSVALGNQTIEIGYSPWRMKEIAELSFNNTQTWLTSARFSNANESLITSDYVHKLILNTSPRHILQGSKEVLGQTLSFAESSFMNWEKSENVTQLAYRLAFLALHENQYGPARKEARSRIERQHDPVSSSVLSENNIGPFDFECDPHTKYLIADYGARFNGFGITTQSFINKFLAAVSSGRVLIPRRSPRWNKLNSCPRHDLQCTFLPLSPCVLTNKDIDDGVIID